MLVGCILYEMLLGDKLFAGQTPPAIMMAHFQPLNLPQTWPEGVPSAVAAVLTIALAKQPNDRYATAGEMIAELTRMAETEPKAAHDEGRQTRAARILGNQAASALPLFEQPETKYAFSGDISIAYQVMVKGPFDLVVIPPFVSHLEVAWEYPPYVRLLKRLASFSRLVVFDKRGTGLSDRTVNIASLEERMDDVSFYGCSRLRKSCPFEFFGRGTDEYSICCDLSRANFRVGYLRLGREICLGTGLSLGTKT
jgi:hypothetical protein